MASCRQERTADWAPLGALLVVLGGTVDVEGGGAAVVVPDPPPTYWLYEEECAVLRSTPKKLK